MNTLELKNKIIERIIEIDDITILTSIHQLFNTSDKNISNLFKHLSETKQEESINKPENYTNYIKLWVKNM